MFLNLLNKLSLFFVISLNFIANPFSLNADWMDPPFTFGITTGETIARIGSDANGNAIAFAPAGAETAYFSNGAWGPINILQPSFTNASDFAMENSGTALAVWSLPGTSINSSYFNGTTWTTPPANPLDTSAVDASIAVAMNGTGSGIAVWINFATNNVNSSIFSNGNWSPITTIAVGTGLSAPSVAYSTNGTAIASWTAIGNLIYVSHFDGSTWSFPLLMEAVPFGYFSKVGMDSQGNGIALWKNTTNNIIVSHFIGTWQAPLSLGVGTANRRDYDLAMSKNGTAVVVWNDVSSTIGLSRSYTGSSWQAPLQFATDITVSNSINNVSVSVNDSGNALAVWFTGSQVKSSRLPFGSAWQPEEIVDASVDPTTISVVSSLSNTNAGFAAWSVAAEGFEYFANAMIAPIAPPSMSVSVCKNKFVTQTDYINIIRWTPSPDPTVVSYQLSRNGCIIAIIPAFGPFVYYDHNSCKGFVDVYTLIAINADGIESAPITVTLE